MKNLLSGCFWGLHGGGILISPSKSLMDKPTGFRWKKPENRWNVNVFKEFVVYGLEKNETPGRV
ncbi:MAG: hypothetical protein IIY29_01305 [Firmicutes bacterium]|nr:hypothetical protein [Bacillota bacterium]